MTLWLRVGRRVIKRRAGKLPAAGEGRLWRPNRLATCSWGPGSCEDGEARRTACPTGGERTDARQALTPPCPGADSALARGPSPRVALGGPAGPGEADDGPGRPCAGPGRAGLRRLGRGLRGGKATERGRYPERVRTAACPEVGATSPLSILNVVLFPAPLAPSSPKHCAGRGGGVSPRAAGGGVRL